jgi:hypothetical protein
MPGRRRCDRAFIWPLYNRTMARIAAFSSTKPHLLPVLNELSAREPIFHRPAFASTLEDFERMLAPDYWEVGASGRRYSRDFILQMLADSPPVDATTVRWRASGFGLRELGPETYLLTYSLRQGERLTRRSTIWQRVAEGWRILYHQGTIVSANEGDIAQ